MPAELEELLRRTSPSSFVAPDTAAMVKEVRRRRGRRRSCSALAVTVAVVVLALATGPEQRPAPAVPTIGDPPPAIQLDPDDRTDPDDPLPTRDGEAIVGSGDLGAGAADDRDRAGSRQAPQPPVPSPPVAVSTPVPNPTPRPSRPAPGAAPRLTTSWTFDAGPDDWYDGGGNDHAGVFAGERSANTRDTDPRYGWTHDPEGRNGTGAFRAWRTTGGDRASVGSPWVELPAAPEVIRVSLWYRWHRSAEDVVVVSIGTGRELERPVEVARLRSVPSALGVWQQLQTDLPSDLVDGLHWLAVYVDARYATPGSDPDCGSAPYPESCDLGFRFDDVSVRVW